MNRNKIKILLLLFFIQITFPHVAISKDAEVFYVDLGGYDQRDLEEFRLACDLLGIRFSRHFINTTNDATISKSISELHNKDALILSDRVLQYFNKDNVSLFGQGDRKAKILIAGINSNTNIAYLNLWSGNKFKNFQQFHLQGPTVSIKVIENQQIARDLGDIEFPLIGSSSKMINGFKLADSVEVTRLIDVVDESGKRACPIFLNTDSAGKSVFFVTSWEKIMPKKINGLLKIMPILMFLKYSFGDRCWHGVNHYANFTIDDPWLREPYGYISFKKLCKNAKETIFHVTIGFIPYNYRKSNDDVIDIFRHCSENLSISIHGNNHNLSEFRSLGNSQLSDSKLTPIHPDEKNILQALYRMDAFTRNTGISYDRVMIFPRGAFTEESLGLLKKHNFLMTVNRGVPFDKGHPKNHVDRMRGISLEFETFPMLMRFALPDRKDNRHATSAMKNWVQMRFFLGLPVLLYTHHDFFKDGMEGFNSIANTINTLNPDVIWASLGTIAKKLYLQKRNDSGEMEILSFSSDINVENNYHESMKFVIRKQEDFSIPIKSVHVDGVNHEYVKESNYIRIECLLEPGRGKNVRILYHSDYQVGSFSYSDSGMKTFVIRALSDFRDIYLPRFPFGDKLVSLFYSMGGVKNVGIVVSGIMGIFFILLVLYLKIKYSKKTALLE